MNNNKLSLAKQCLNILEDFTPINERLAIRGLVKKHNIIYLFSTGRYSNAIAYRNEEKNTYSILVFKKNDLVHPGLWGIDDTMLNKSPKEAFLYWKGVALENKILKEDKLEMSPAEFLKYMVTKQGVGISVVSKMFPELEQQEQENVLKDGKIEIIYQNEKEAQHILSLIKEAEKILKKNGFGYLVFGKFYSTPSLGSKAIADYSIANDTIRISNKAKKSETAVKTLIHELGHRLWYKYMTQKDHLKVQEKYYEVLRGNNISINKGDKFKNEKGRELVIIDKKFGYSYKDKYIFQYVDDTSVKYEAPLDFFKYQAQPIDKEFVRDIFDVSAYAKTSVTEFFPEVFSWGQFKNNKELIDWVKQFGSN
jgi:hypothetical protein